MSQSTPKQRFQEAAVLFRNKDHAGALAIFDELLAAHPQSAPLHFHRGRCLIELNRPDEATAALDAALALDRNHVPLLLERVNLGGAEDFDPLPLLRHAQSLEPDNAQVLFLLAETELLATGNDSAHCANALALLDRSLELAPDRAEAWALRGSWHQGRAMNAQGATRMVRDLHGLEYDRDALEAALQDFTRAAALGDGSVHDYRCAKLAEQLGDYELATRHYDHMLARLPADAGNREHVRSERDRCAQGEAGARAATAELFEQMAATASSERSLGEDMFHSINQGVATMVRHGADVPSALDALVGDDSPDGLTATHIAIQIYNYGHEPDPDLIEVSAADYPRYQRAHANACTKPMAAQGYVHLGDVEAQGLTQSLGQSVLVRLFVHPEVGSAAAFALKPKWPGLVGFVLAFVTGKWKTARMLECMTRFEDGVFMGSRAAGPDPFDNNGDPRIAFETLPAKATPRQVTQRHLERVKARLAEGHAVCTVDSVATVDCHWAENTAIKREYRQGLGYITDAEMRALLGVHHDRLAGTIRARLNALAST